MSSELPTAPNFCNLPHEISTHIVALSVADGYPFDTFTFRALIRVSPQVRIIAYAGCLPHLPVVLYTQKHLQSFNALLCSHPEFGPKVQSLFLATRAMKKSSVEGAILRTCCRIKSLACYLQPLHLLIEKIIPFSHECLRDLTIMISNVPWNRLLAHPNGQQLFRQLTHFRSAGVGRGFLFPEFCIPDCLASNFSFSSLTHLSFNCKDLYNIRFSRSSLQSEHFPALQHIVPTIPFVSYSYGDDRWLKSEGRSIDARVTVFPCPEDWREVEVWEDARMGGADVWEIAMIPDDSSDESDSESDPFEGEDFFFDWGMLPTWWTDATDSADEDDGYITDMY